MFYVTLLGLLLLKPGSAAVMASPSNKSALWSNSKMFNDSPNSENTRQHRSVKMPDVTHLELLVVIGPDVYNVHKQDTERYILTNLNIASELLRDITLGANMRVHLVRMIILSEPEPEIQMSSNITASLKSVCNWAKRINPPNDTSPLHADLVLYITRYDLVLPDGNRQVRGVAQLGGVCTEDWSCVITEDTGFDLGITVAHEIGHSFGLNHDGVGNRCSRSGFMMASNGGYNSVDLTWSSCSRQQLLTFFSNGKAACVKDLPVLGGSLQNWKPGLYYGVDDQCRIAFGKKARACTFTNSDFPPCRVLSCHVDSNNDSSCKRLLVPLLDGTECGLNQWCLKGRCVSPAELGSSVVVHGSWSGWSDFTPCSRTCGGGVTLRTRLCNNPKPAFGGHQCVGPETQAELCDQKPCQRTQLDFMAEQCSLTDPHPLYLQPNTASFYTWIPAIGIVKGNDQCRHMCQSKGENFIVSRGSQFMDGTRCELESPVPFGSTAACLKGKCQVFGCDGILHSPKVYDECGVCGGDGSSCTLTSGTFTGGSAKKYITFLSLPLNATQVHIVNWAPLFTHMAVSLEGQYIVSGKGSMALNMTHPSSLDDNHLQYHLHLTSDLLPAMEELLLSGPVQQEIQIQVFRKYGKEYEDKTNPNITYTFYKPTNTRSSKTNHSKGKWTDFVTPCSVSCGTGVQKHLYQCVDSDTNEQLNPEYCRTMPSGPLYTTCQQPRCPPRWKTEEFGHCSLLCGGGERLRSVKCVQEHGDKLLTLPDSECIDTAPSAVEKCNMHHCPTRWHVSEPGKCSAVCGPGEAERNVFCVRAEAGLDVKVNESFCKAESRPPNMVPCVVNVCPSGGGPKTEGWPFLNVDFMPRSRPTSVFVWSPVRNHCTKTCGNGTQQVWFSCVDHQTRLGVPDFHCDASTRPQSHSAICNTSPCPPMWRTKQGLCSVTCGGGVAKRVLYCAVERQREEAVVDDAECQDFPKPNAVVACNNHSCPARWKVLQTLNCSVSCGLGVTQRTVLCVQFLNGKESVVPDKNCHAAVKPAVTVPCLVQVCTFRWEVKPWTQCSVTCGYGIQSRAVACVGPSNPEAVSPLLCMHMPKPITIQGCNVGCLNEPSVNLTTISTAVTLSISPNPTERPLPSLTMSYKRTPHHSIGNLDPTGAITVSMISACGRLILDESGTLDLSNATGRCMVSIGRPLDEVIHIEVVSSSLNCSNREYVAFFDRLSFVRKCEQVNGSALITRTNVLLIRQNLLIKGNGVVLKYNSQKNVKKSHRQECDMQLFAPTGIFENPATLITNQTCRVLINAPPSVKIKIQAKHIGLVFNASVSHSTYIMIRDMDVLKTNVFKGQQLFEWHSSGNMAEVEFHGDYLRSKGTFRAEYCFIK